LALNSLFQQGASDIHQHPYDAVAVDIMLACAASIVAGVADCLASLPF
jgi:hypothetical protein